MPTPDYRSIAISNFKDEGNKYQLKYETVLQHIKDLYTTKCQCIELISHTRNILASTDNKDEELKDIINRIDTLCQTFRLEESTTKHTDYFSEVSVEPITALAVKTTVDDKTLTSIPPVPYNCVALAYLMDNELLGDSNKDSIFNITSITMIGGKAIGKLFLGMLGPAGMAISGLSFINKSIKKTTKNMNDAMKISFLSDKLSEHASTLDKIDMKLCCIMDELNGSLNNISHYIYVDKSFSKLSEELLKLSNALTEKI